MSSKCVLGASRWVLIAALIAGAGFGAVGCRDGGGNTPRGTGGSMGDGSVDRPDVSVDGGGKPNMMNCGGATGHGSTDLGQACVCHNECGSGSCVDGVCCNSACGDKCMACNLPGSEGTCAAVPDGVKPREQSECAPSPESSCGQDGTCNGMGACRKHVLGTICVNGTCDGDGMSGINICDGAGACKPGPAASCFPYTCGGGKCLSRCSADKDCSAGRMCIGNSCGKLPTGRGPCTSDDECTSGHCADGVCCNVGCSGECVSCNQTGFAGQCRPLGAGIADAMCAVQPRSTCGTTGVCNDFGECARYPAETTCIAPQCAGSMSNTAGTCDGEGTCRPPGQIDCAPFMCLGEGCVKTCTTNAQCVAPNSCVNGTCGPKPMGSPCTGASQCASGQCVDGVCCDSPCTGACQSCSLQSSLGQCKNVARGAVDPHGQCKDTGATSCATDGKCDGSGGCRKYAVDTVCGPETCAGGAYTPPATCNASGQCIPPDSETCAPFACNGTKCFETCTVNTQCVGSNTCVIGSCGLKPAGAKCSAAEECQPAGDGKKYCAQGVCCNGPCTTTCQACNLAGSLGKCTAAPNGVVDPQKKCATTAASTCGGNGKCRGGVCDTYHTTDQCKPAACSNATTALAASFCDGRGGACPAQTASGCGVYVCDTGTGSCKNSCTTNGDCVAPNTCNNGSCGMKANGASCSGAAQCVSGHCTEGVCCNTACTDATTGTCQSCKVAGKVGTCSPVPVGGADPKARCLASARTSCGLNGTCDGTGKCDFWDTTVGCRAQSCTGSTQTNTSNCNGNGACSAATTKACDPYICNTAAATCRTTCTSTADCNAGITCNTQTNKCGDKLPNGRVCTVGSDCTSANCVKALAGDTTGICCNTTCTGGCESCALTGKVGTCSPIAAGGVPRVAMCAPTANVCGNTGRCDGGGGCQIATAGTPCSDGNLCTGGDICQAGTCKGTAKTCTATDPCHMAGTCDLMSGNCSVGAIVGVDDGNPCTADSCSAAGGIVHTPVNTNDNNACTTDACNMMTGAVTHTAVNTNDNNACTTDACNMTTGAITHVPVVTDDNNPCTVDTCNMTTGAVTHVAIAVSDNNACTTDACNMMTGAITHVPVDPDDGDMCTIDACTPVGGVTHTSVSLTDNDACTTDTCTATGGVKHTPVNPDDNNACTTDTCTPVGGVKHTPVNTDDDDACTTDTCTPTGGVKHTPVNPDDDDACTTDTCTAAGGVKHTPVNTDDKDACTTDTCTPAGGVKHTPVACPADQCHPGMCEDGKCAVVVGTCDDNDPCTLRDMCNASGRCSGTTAVDGTVCGPGNSPKVCCGGICSDAGSCAAPAMSI